MSVYLVMGLYYNEGVNEDTAMVFWEISKAHEYGEFLIKNQGYDSYTLDHLFIR